MVSKKVELMRAMLPIEKKLELYSNITIGVGLSIVVFMILSYIPAVIQLTKDFDKEAIVKSLSWYEICFSISVVLSIGFIISGYWNFREETNFGGVITRQSIAALMVISILEVANLVLMILSTFSKKFVIVTISVYVVYPFIVTIGFAIFALILYTLGNEQGIAAKYSANEMKTFDEEFE